MSILIVLVPLAVFMGLLGLTAFLWAQGDGQFDDPDGSAARILQDTDCPLPPKKST